MGLMREESTEKKETGMGDDETVVVWTCSSQLRTLIVHAWGVRLSFVSCN